LLTTSCVRKRIICFVNDSLPKSFWIWKSVRDSITRKLDCAIYKFLHPDLSELVNLQNDFWKKLFNLIPKIIYSWGIKMEKEYTIVIEQDEDGIYVASVPELKGCHTQAKTLDELRERIKEAIQLYLEVESSIVEGVPLKFIGIQKVEISV